MSAPETAALSTAGPSPELVPISQLTPAPWNPRTIRDTRFQNLCRSLEADPDFLWRRPILASLDGVVMAGNMRLRAAQYLHWDAVPAIVEDVPEHLAKERALRDNNAWGDWQEDDLSALLAELYEAQSDLDLLGFDDGRLNALLELSGINGEQPVDPDKALDEWRGMPAFEQEDQKAYRSIIVHLANQDAVDAFAELVGHKITPQTRYLWYPEIEIAHYADKRYGPES